MDRIKIVFRIICIFGCMQLLVLGVSASDMMFRYNAARTGDYSPVAGTTGTTVSELWNFTTSSSFVYSTPAVANGLLYAGCHDSRVYALNATTGVEKWNYTTGGVVESSPAVVNGVVYVGSFDKKVYAIDAITGVEKWNYSTRSGIMSSPAVANDIVYIGSSDKDVYALDADTGAMIWNYTTTNEVESSPAVANGVVYVGSTDTDVYALNANTGAKIWQNSTDGAVRSSPAVVNGVVYIGSGDTYVYAFDAATGIRNWRYKTAGTVYYSSPAVVNNVVYVGSYDDKLHAINATTGAGIWNYSTAGGFVKTSPAVANGIVYFGTSNHNITALNATYGLLVWNFKTSDQVDSSPVVVNGIVYVGGWDNKIHALNTNGGGHKVTSKIGVQRYGSIWYLDYNGNGVWNGAAVDRQYTYGLADPLVVTGDWNFDGKTEVGVFRNSNHLFYLDYNGNGAWNGAETDRSYDFGLTGDIPATGDWNSDGITEIGVFRPSTHLFYLDYNGNGAWNGAVTDRSYDFGLTGDIPVTGDWNNDGFAEIGVFRPSTHIFYLDYNGNGAWNGASVDRSYNFGLTGDIPITGVW